MIEAVIRDDPEALLAFREAMKHQGERSDLGNIIPEVDRQHRGTSRAYSLDRVNRECDPETVAAVMAGEPFNAKPVPFASRPYYGRT